MTLALLFPGQGSQHVGMGRELAESSSEAEKLFERADEILGFSLSEIMWEGPEEELTETRNAQPAILVHSVAAYRLLADHLDDVAYAAGHSLGEFSAYVAAGSLAFEEALEAVRLRGELMFEAGQERSGAMAAILGLGEDEVEEVCQGVESGICVPANFNSSGQVVISGDEDGVQEGMERARDAGAKRVVELNVSGAFHSPLMEPAADGLRERLETIDFSDPDFPVISNVTAKPVSDGDEAREFLVRQLTSPVRWAASVEAMVAAGVQRFVELGPGRVLCGLNRRNARGKECVSVGTPGEVDAFQEEQDD